MQQNLYQYTANTGEIYASLENPSQDAIDHFATERPEISSFVANAVSDFLNYWYDGEAMLPKADMPVTLDKASIKTDGVDAATFSMIPEGCVVMMDGHLDVSNSVANAVLVIESEEQGSYTFEFSAKGYQPASFEVDAS